MIRMIPSSSPGQAKAYFSDALCKSDYYINDQELQGVFAGKLAERLNISGPASKETFFRLCENKHPNEEKTLTPKTRDDRITGWDINFHCPKSVSVLHVLAKDNHILEAFEASVKETMDDIETDAKTRVRKNGNYEDRQTGELAYASFTHQTARPAAGKDPDPHLHAHCFVFNATWDEEEKQFKAAKVRDIKRDMPYYQNLYEKRFSDKLIALGYQIRKTEKSFDVIGVPQKIIDHFSKRTNEIGQFAKEKGIADSKAMDALGARTRSKKQKGLTMETLKESWKAQLKELSKDINQDELEPVRFAPTKEKPILKESDCVDYAVTHCFERQSVVHDRRVIEKAYRFAIGDNSLTVKNISENFYADNRLLQVDKGGRKMLTTKEVLAEEKRMVQLAKAGKGILIPFYKEPPQLSLAEQQAAAVSHILTTGNRLSIVRGAAGTGKTTLMTEAVKHIENAGKKITVIAPTAQASRSVLKNEGFKDAETVAKFLQDITLQEKINNQVLWVDEAGLIGTKDMASLLDIATRQNARIILGGDTRQHSSVVRGDALRILGTVAKIPAAEVTKIYRQKDEIYKAAVEELSRGHIQKAFEKLNSLEAIKTVDALNPNDRLVEDYLDATKKGKTALVISPTHEQGEAVSNAIRNRLQESGRLSKKEANIKKLSNKNWTEAQKSDRFMYKPGQVIQFNQNCKGIKRGSVFTIKKNDNGKIMLVDKNGGTLELPAKVEKHLDIYETSEMKLAKGDAVRITKNGFDVNGKRIDNGTSLTVAAIDKKGNLILENKKGKNNYEVDKDFGHITHDYCITSHASQGKTFDEVFIAQPSSTFTATDLKQFYVSVSRGREKVHIYTDDKEALIEYASEMGDRQSALELMSSQNSELDFVLEKQQREYSDKPFTKKDHYKDMSKLKTEKEYEPEF